jgi:hypothetical protein
MLEEEEDQVGRQAPAEAPYSAQVSAAGMPSTLMPFLAQVPAAAEEEARKKKELDNLFLRELGGLAPPPKSQPAPRAASAPANKGKVLEFRMPGVSAAPRAAPAAKPVASNSSDKVVVEKAFDFAGETITFDLCSKAAMRSFAPPV